MVDFQKRYLAETPKTIQDIPQVGVSNALMKLTKAKQRLDFLWFKCIKMNNTVFLVCDAQLASFVYSQNKCDYM